MMKSHYVLVDFITTAGRHGECEIVMGADISEIINKTKKEMETWDKECEVEVSWKDGKVYAAKIIQICADRLLLVQTMKKFLAGTVKSIDLPIFAVKDDMGKRKPVPKIIPDEFDYNEIEENIVKGKSKQTKQVCDVQRKTSRSILAEINNTMKDSKCEDDCWGDDEMAVLSDDEDKVLMIKYMELKKKYKILNQKYLEQQRHSQMNSDMDNILEKMKVQLNAVTNLALKLCDVDNSGKNNSSTSITSCDENTCSSPPQKKFKDDVIEIGPSLSLPRTKLMSCSKSNLSKYASDLLMVTFGSETLATHVLKGAGPSKKKVLDPEIVEDIRNHVLKTFPDGTMEAVMKAMRNKLNNESKKYKSCVSPQGQVTEVMAPSTSA